MLARPIPSQASDTVDFDAKIRPILASRCLTCHGADEPEADLDLTQPHDATLALLAPGEPVSSELIARVKARDDSRMPPEGSPLSDEEVRLLELWIEQGAAWPSHWSFRPLAPSPTPHVSSVPFQQWTRNSIDAGIAEAWSKHDLHPVAEAPKHIQLRRLSFDLLGLPPDAEELDRFQLDSRPDAWERVVDRMLASPRFGERQARHWMDQVHFAETHGHDQDRPRDNAWPYRDYLIDRFNADTPYSQFVVEQIAGDTLSTDDPWSTVATGFLAAGPWDESSLRDIREDAPDREVARYLDRDDIVTTVMTTFAGVSIQCARCHEHKFDPITQDDYYGLQAIFAATDKANRAIDLDPAVASNRKSLSERLNRWELFDPSVAALPEPLDESSLSEQLASIRQIAAAWQVPPPIEAKSLAGATITIQEDHSALISGPRPDKETTTIRVPLDVPTLTAVRLEVLSDKSLPFEGPGRCDNGNLHVTEWRIAYRPSSDERWIELEMASCKADFDQEGWTAAHAIDGNPTTAWGIYPQVGRDHQLVGVLSQPLDVSGSAPELRVEVLQAHGGSHLIGRARVSVSGDSDPAATSEPLPDPSMLEALASPQLDLSQPSHRSLVRWIKVRELREQLAQLPPQQLVYCGTNQFAADGSFRPAATPRPVQVLHRGLTTEPIREAAPGAIEFLESLVAYRIDDAHLNDDQARRRALADWLIDSSQPLTWRVMANRLWIQHFGTGLVTTPNDFGQMGAPPSHPWMLDDLAIHLRDSDSLKLLHRKILLSASYRLGSDDDSHCAAIDGASTFRWRMSRRRLDAESIRDGLLEISGALDNRMGGPSSKQFVQSPGIHVTPIVDYQAIGLNDPAFRRRSVYRFIFRTVPDPFYDSLDCPDASQWTPQRNTSLTAVQALATLHDRQVALSAERLAMRLNHECGDDRERAARVWKLLYSREASDAERELIREFAQQHGWSATCLFLINANEFMFVD